MESWRLVIDGAMNGAWNMAADEAMLASSECRGCVPTLRLYRWSEPTLTIGYAQDSTPFAAGLPLVRRLTGGRAVLHDMELTYSVVASTSHPLFSDGIMDAYRLISTSIVEALNECGVKAEFAPPPAKPRLRGDRYSACFRSPSRYEVLAGGKKLAGSAQRRFKNAFLQHGSILFNVDRYMNESVFGPGILDKMGWVGEHSGVSIEDFTSVFVRCAARSLGARFTPSTLDPEEVACKKALHDGKYTASSWNLHGADVKASVHGRVGPQAQGRFAQGL